MGLFGIFKGKKAPGILSDEAIREHVPSIDRLAPEFATALKRYHKEVRAPKWATNGVLDINEALRVTYPNADDRTCPNCGSIHEKPVRRGRTCTHCDKKFIVKGGKLYKNGTVDKIYATFHDIDEKIRLNARIDRVTSKIKQTDDYIEKRRAMFDAVEIIAHDAEDYDTAWSLACRAQDVAYELDHYFSSKPAVANFADNLACVRGLQTKMTVAQAADAMDGSKAQKKHVRASLILYFAWIHERAIAFEKELGVITTAVDGGKVSDFFDETREVSEGVEECKEMISDLKLTGDDIEEYYRSSIRLLGGATPRAEVETFKRLISP